ncbi:DAO domain containing protein [Asbolus verrucosus]|uniref:DAO domain containing protein n=1 Tax=Asbolus verrucosus TaxID=1661398 RepID=A0A482VBQ6_ASBVE|nr:DAO domain containing protein [Asbolus verrucosus]
MFDVAVIGCGVIGLPTALAVQNDLGPRARVVIFTEKLSPYTTGDVAAGLWTPYLLQSTPQNKIVEWSKTTQDFILKLWKQGEARDAGVSLQLMVNLSDDENFQLPEWVKITLGHSEFSQEQIKYYSRKYNQQFTGGYAFVSFIWEPSKFLPYLQRKFLQNGGEIKLRRIEDFDELSHFDVVVNCTGLYSRVLVPDSSVQPIRGQVARVSAPWQFHSILINSEHNDNYVIPNENCVILGGTHQVDDYNTNIDEDDKRKILSGCCKLVPSLEKAPVIKHSAGLRPGRSQVRIELEHRRIGNKIMKIVHNYGHGGSGITLSIGCAVDAARLVKEALGANSQSKL